jgi:hypothetical protein
MWIRRGFDPLPLSIGNPELARLPRETVLSPGDYRRQDNSLESLRNLPIAIPATSQKVVARPRRFGPERFAIQEALNGKVVDWIEKVSDEQYRR